MQGINLLQLPNHNKKYEGLGHSQIKSETCSGTATWCVQLRRKTLNCKAVAISKCNRLSPKQYGLVCIRKSVWCRATSDSDEGSGHNVGSHSVCGASTAWTFDCILWNEIIIHQNTRVSDVIRAIDTASVTINTTSTFMQGSR